VEGKSYTVAVSEGGDITGLVPINGSAAPEALGDVTVRGGESIVAPLGGIICKVLVKPGQQVNMRDPVFVLEAMKMETEISTFKAGTVVAVDIQVGDSVAVGDVLLTIA